MNEITCYLIFSAVIFTIGLAGLIIRKNIIVQLMSVELLLNSANIAFLAYSKQSGDSSFHAVSLFIMAIAATEAALGLALVILIFRYRGTISSDKLTSLKG